MKDERIIKTRKAHECGVCGEEIQPGEKAYFFEGKSGKYDVQDNQIGIEYWKNWHHAYACHLTPEQREACEAGNHLFEPGMELDHYVDCNAVWLYTGFDYCGICGIRKESEL